jgi:hypothetical protein
VIGLALLAILAWTAWPESPSPPASGAVGRPTVTGMVRIEGGSAVLGGNYPLRHAKLVVTGMTTLGVPLLRHFRADFQGHFKLGLPAGRYTVTGIAFSPAMFPLSTPPHAIVTVIRGHLVDIRLTWHVI